MMMPDNTSPSLPAPPLGVTPRRVHLTRLMSLWRSAGWPSRDPVEIDLIAAGWVSLHTSSSGHETLRLTEAGLQLLAAARQRNQRARSLHERLARRVATQLMAAGRLVWLELPLRAMVPLAPAPAEPGAAEAAVVPRTESWWPNEAAEAPADPATASAASQGKAWRLARPDVFSVRHTSVERYLQPMVHEVKVSRADLLSDLRHHAKRVAYQGLCSECHYVFPAGLAEPDELPSELGVWLLHGDVDSGRLEVLRPARHVARKLPFALWMALAQATPLRPEHAELQAQLGAPPDAEPGELP